ncbi:MAG: hypothetical protein AAGF54_05670 [Pseudomonadota bacterium]
MVTRNAFPLLGILLLTACVSSGDQNVLQSVIQPEIQPAETNTASVVPQPQSKPIDQAPQVAFASQNTVFETVPKPVNRKTYLINGLASSVDSIGYGFSNLAKKIPNSELYNYASFVESSTVIRRRVAREIKAEYAADPNVEINMIGISFGANIVTWIASELARKNIPINYMVTIEGPAMSPIRDNVSRVDNFSCTGLTCFRTKSRVARGNRTTVYNSFKYNTSHIALADHPKVHQRILEQIEPKPEPIPEATTEFAPLAQTN